MWRLQELYHFMYLAAEFARVCYITDADFQTAGIERRPRPWESSPVWGVGGCREGSNLEPTGSGQGEAMSGVLGDLWKSLANNYQEIVIIHRALDLWRVFFDRYCEINSVAEPQVKDDEVDLFELLLYFTFWGLNEAVSYRRVDIIVGFINDVSNLFYNTTPVVKYGLRFSNYCKTKSILSMRFL